MEQFTRRRPVPRKEWIGVRPFFAIPQTLLGAALLLLMAVALAPSNRAHAQGFGVYEQGTCTMSRGGAAVANPCDDGSAVFFNPAGLTGDPGLTVSAGATLIMAQGDFTDDATGTTTELDNPPIPVPHAYVRYGATDRLAAGLGVYVPYGLGTEWPADFEGSFLGYDNNLQSIYVQPTLAYQLTDRIAVGGGLTVVIGSVELNQRLDLSQQAAPGITDPEGNPVTFSQLGIPFHTDFADAQLEATGATGFGGNFGIQVQATDRIQLGARFMTPVQLDYSGTAEFSQVNTDLVLYGLIDANGDGVPDPVPVDNLLGPLFQQGPLTEQDVETSITMPAQLVAGVSVQATDRLALLADYQWTGWSTFDELELDFETAPDRTLEENYNDTHALRLGVEYEATEAWQLRAGFLTHGAAAPDETVTPLLPEAYRNEFTAGVGWRATDLVELNVAYQYIQQNDRRGRVRDARPGEEDPSAEALNSGLYSFNAHLIGTTLTLHF